MRAPRSLRWRLQIWHGLLLVAVLAVFGFTTAELERSRRMERIDAELQSRASMLSRLIAPEQPGHAPEQPGRGPESGLGEPPLPQPGGDPDDPAPPPPPPRRGAASGAPALHLSADEARRFGPVSGGYYYAIWLKNSPGMVRSGGAPADIPRPTGSEGWRSRGNYREVFNELKPQDYVLVGRDRTDELADWRRLTGLTLAAGLGVAVLGLLGGAWLTRRALRPVGLIGDAAEAIAAGDLSRRISVEEEGSELGRLAAVLNHTFARLEAVFEQQARFTADAAHELRTPVAVLLMQAQNGLDDSGLTAEARAALSACLRAAQRMRGLIESLLELARWDAGEAKLRRINCDLAPLAEAESELLRPLADGRGVKLVLRLEPAPCSGDPDRLAQVVANLLINAVQHSPVGGTVGIQTGVSGGRATVAITDEGGGIAAEHLPRIFDRFYRAEAARSQGRSGLGLAICRAIVAAHGGTIEAGNRPQGGAWFRVAVGAEAKTG